MSGTEVHLENMGVAEIQDEPELEVSDAKYLVAFEVKCDICTQHVYMWHGIKIDSTCWAGHKCHQQFYAGFEGKLAEEPRLRETDCAAWCRAVFLGPITMAKTSVRDSKKS